MKFVRYQIPEQGIHQTGLGVRRGHALIPLEQLFEHAPTRMRDLLAMELPLNRMVERLAEAKPLDEPVKILVPVGEPRKIICVGLNYRDHAIETGKQPPTEPVIFSKLSSALIADGQPIVLPKLSDQVDYEAELVVVIGQGGRDIAEGSAMEHVFGYTCGHDVSSRDWQYHHSGGQWLLGKSFDTFAPLGPSITHRSAIADPGQLKIQMRINDELLQDSSTSELIFSIPSLIHFLSQIFMLEPGDLIFTGTPAGVGVARKPQRFLKAGDRCEVRIEGLDPLCNPVE